MKWKCSVLDYKPSPESAEQEAHFHAELERLGIKINTLDGSDGYNQDKLEAIGYISAMKKVPYDLEQRLLATQDAKPKKVNKTITDFNESNIDDFFGVEPGGGDMEYKPKAGVYIATSEEIEVIPRIPKGFSLECTELAKRHLEMATQKEKSIEFI